MSRCSRASRCAWLGVRRAGCLQQRIARTFDGFGRRRSQAVLLRAADGVDRVGPQPLDVKPGRRPRGPAAPAPHRLAVAGRQVRPHQFDPGTAGRSQQLEELCRASRRCAPARPRPRAGGACRCARVLRTPSTCTVTCITRPARAPRHRNLSVDRIGYAPVRYRYGPAGARGAVLQVANVIRLAALVRLAATDDNENAVSVAGVGHVRPAEGGDFRPTPRGCSGSRATLTDARHGP